MSGNRTSILTLVFLLALGSLQPAQGAPATFTVSGTFEARTWRVMSEVSARVREVQAHEGDNVAAGTVVIRLDPGPLQQEVNEARAALKAARAHLADLEAQPLPGPIQVAKGQVESAQAAVSAAEKQAAVARAALKQPVSLDNQITLLQAQRDILNEELDAARAQRKQALVTRDYYRTLLTEEGRTRAAIAQKQLDAAEAHLKAVQAEIAGNRRLLSALQDIREHPLALEAQLHQAEGQVRVARAQEAVAHAGLALAQAPARAEDLAQARAQVAQARAELDLLQAQMARYTLTAPVSGTVSARQVEPGEIAQAGQSLLEISDLRVLDLIVYIPERKLGNVFLGQPVTLHVDAFPHREFRGRVVWIADEAEFTPKNVQTKADRVETMFRVKVRVSNPEGLLKAGMPADATFQER